jgi:hypothetical protein
LQIFERLRAEQPNFHKKVLPIQGDVEAENLAMSPDDRQRLADR